MRKKIVLPMLVLIFLALLSGGTDAVDVNRTIFVVGAGIDRGENGDGYEYTFYAASPTGADSAVGDNNVTYRSVTVSADSMSSAVRKLEQGSARSISFEHLNCAVLGASVLGEDLSAVMDYLLQVPDVRRQSIVLALNGSAADFFSAPVEGNIASAAAETLERLDGSDSHSSIMTLGRLSGTLESRAGYCLYIIGLADAPSELSGSDVSGIYCLDLKGLAVFDSGGLSGKLSRGQAELARLFTHGQASGLITSVDSDGNRFFYEITYSRCRVGFTPGEPCRASIEIDIECVLLERSDVTAEPPDDLTLSEHLHGQLEQLISLSRDYGAAVTGLETEARRSHRLWFEGIKDRWDSIYRGTVIDLRVNCVCERIYD